MSYRNWSPPIRAFLRALPFCTAARCAVVLTVLGACLLSGCASGSHFFASPHASHFEADDPLRALLAPRAPEVPARAEAPALDLAALEREIHARVNAIRAAHDLPPLAWQEALAPVARGHSQDMAARAYFSHANPEGEFATERAQDTGLTCGRQSGSFYIDGVGENLFLTHRFSAYYVRRQADGDSTYTFDWKTLPEIAEQAVQGWMQSRSHRANLLSPLYESAALGAALGAHHTVFVTQNFSCGAGT